MRLSLGLAVTALVAYGANAATVSLNCGAGLALCPTGQCCSQYGYCGTGTSYCAAGACQPRYSALNACAAGSSDFCGLGKPQCPSGQCCSKYGYCGTGTPYCGTGCQALYSSGGTCSVSSSSSTSSSTTSKSTTSSSSSSSSTPSSSSTSTVSTSKTSTTSTGSTSSTTSTTTTSTRTSTATTTTSTSSSTATTTTKSTSSTPTPTGTPGGIDSSCGAGLPSCGTGLCCSAYGYCGNTPGHCQAGSCQPRYSALNACAAGSSDVCGSGLSVCPAGQCCSKYGYCGAGTPYCGTGCQALFSDKGTCSAGTPPPTDIACGNGIGSCPIGQCCSKAGFCGVDAAHCDLANGAQPRYGLSSSPDVVIDSQCVQSNMVAFSFDDGPWPDTDLLLSKFEVAGGKVTLFVTGNYNMETCVYDRAATLQRAYKNGHQIAHHTWSHPDLAASDEAGIGLEVGLTNVALRKITGIVPRFLRPPYSSLNDLTIERLRLFGIAHVTLWDLDTLDWESPNATLADQEAVLDSAVTTTGHLFVSHDGIPTTPTNLVDYMISWAKKRNLRMVTVGECVGDTVFYQSNVTAPATRDASWVC